MVGIPEKISILKLYKMCRERFFVHSYTFLYVAAGYNAGTLFLSRVSLSLLITLTCFLFQELSMKTKDLINKTKSLAPSGEKLTLEVLRAHKLSPAQETFLYTLAAVEGFAQL